MWFSVSEFVTGQLQEEAFEIWFVSSDGSHADRVLTQRRQYRRDFVIQSGFSVYIGRTDADDRFITISIDGRR
jgi:hypothetical protein